jgi:hypothetical protein
MGKKRKGLKGVIPKKIAGVKVPKAVRSGRFGELLASKTGQAVIAQAILGAGAVATGFKAKDDPKVREAAKDAKHKVADTAGDAAGAAGDMTATLAFALGEAARSFADALKRHGGEPRSFQPESQADVAADDAALAWAPYGGGPDAGQAAHKGGGRKKQSTALEAGPR